jgi:hypothetical protein
MVQVRADDAAAPGSAVLDLHEGLCAEIGPIPSLDGRFPDPRLGGCKRWPERLWLLSDQGERVPGRCRATNLCDYCARLAAVENTEMLALDAMIGNAPQVWCVLTTRRSTIDMSLFYEGRRQLFRELRRRLGRQIEYSCLLEFTTGYGPRSGGKRRPHWNLLLKGVGVEHLDVVRQVIADVWCRVVEATISAQYVGEISDAGGLMRYIALHFQKESQAPPRGFRGQRFNCSRGYFDGHTRAEARSEARDSLFEKRQLHRALELGLTGDDAEDFVDRAWIERMEVQWRLYSEPPIEREGVSDEQVDTRAVPAPARSGLPRRAGGEVAAQAGPRPRGRGASSSNCGPQARGQSTLAARGQEGPPRADVVPPADPPPLTGQRT